MSDDGQPQQSQEDDSVIDYEQSEEAQAMLDKAPFALPLPVEVLKEQKVRVSEIPEGHLLNRYAGDLEVRVSKDAPRSRSGGLDGFRKAPGAKLGGADASAGPEASVLHTPLPSTNRGKNPNSRWYIRGVLHPQPISMRIGAISTMLVVWLIPASLIAAALLILSVEKPDEFAWVSPQLLWIPAALLGIGLLYLLFGLSGRCKVCNQKLFIYRSHLRNVHAHHFPGLGHVLPLCLHLLVFRWFRCTHCGTPIRLKK